jgi:hypothetical protein
MQQQKRSPQIKIIPTKKPKAAFPITKELRIKSEESRILRLIRFYNDLGVGSK